MSSELIETFIKRLKECDVNEEIHYSGQDFDSMREDMLKLTFDNIGIPTER